MASLVEHESPELRIELIALNGIHQSYQMAPFRQGSGYRHHRIGLTGKSHLEGFCLVYLCHEIATARLGHHPQGCALEDGTDLNTREVPGWTLRVREANPACILYVRIRRTDNRSLDGECLCGNDIHADNAQHGENQRFLHIRSYLIIAVHPPPLLRWMLRRSAEVTVCWVCL